MMNTATIVFIGITLWFALRGFWLGLPTVLVRLVALCTGYATAIFLAPDWVGWVDKNTPLDGLSPYPATLLAAFFGAAFLANLAGSLLIRFSLPEERRHAGKLPAVVINGGFGAVIALLAVWCVGLLQAALYPERMAAPTPAIQSYADKLVASAMAGFVATVSAEQPQRAMATRELMENPVQTVSDLRYMTNHAALNSLLRDPDAQQSMKQDDVPALKNNAAFREFMHDKRAERIFLASGFLPAGTDAENYEEAFAGQLILLWSKVDAVRGNPEFQSITHDPDYRKKLLENDLLSLINDDRSVQLAGLIWSTRPAYTETRTKANTETNTEPSTEKNAETNTQSNAHTSPDVHRWQDTNGRWHFSDNPGS